MPVLLQDSSCSPPFKNLPADLPYLDFLIATAIPCPTTPIIAATTTGAILLTPFDLFSVYVMRRRHTALKFVLPGTR